MSTSSFRPPDNEATARRVMFEASVAAEYAEKRDHDARRQAIVVGIIVGVLVSAGMIAWEVFFA